MTQPIKRKNVMKQVNSICKGFVLFLSVLMFLTAAWLAEASEQVEKVSVPVLSRMVLSGEIIGEQDVKMKEVPVHVAARAFQLKSDVIGMEARRNLRPGYPLSERQIYEPLDVRRGKSVLLSYEKPGLSLVLEGRSLTDGRRGDRVYVLNTHSNKRLSGVVVRPGLVTVQ